MSLQVERNKDITRLYAVINRLPESYREILFLCLSGYKISVIAGKLKVSEKVAQERKEKAYRYLRKHSEGAWGIFIALGGFRN